MADGKFLTIPEAAALAGVHVESIRGRIKRGRLKTVERFGRTLVYRSEVVNFEKLRPGPKSTKKGKK